MSLISAGSISLDSTFNEATVALGNQLVCATGPRCLIYTSQEEGIRGYLVHMHFTELTKSRRGPSYWPITKSVYTYSA
jgi:hypothetical protein